ncbi:patatin-like phospholipase family protein [Algivirga pacifica]|uniref:Patatin-like phospholipase family protein n=1 Tax=Algivirga pacifica TaxID=1162670 RepID=A0ABP9D2L9_9BACT
MNNNRLHVHIKKWTYTKNFKFPEEEHIPIEKKNVGIAFSGGGNRSAPLTIGYLRALHHFDLIKYVKYQSSVSGGAWAGIPYTFLDPSIEDEQFLGEFKAPEKLSFKDIQDVKDFSFTSAVAETRILDDFLKNLDKGDEIFAKVLSNVYLTPFLLGETRKLFTLNQASLETIQSKNSGLMSYDFYTVAKDRPYLIVNSVLSRSNPLKVRRYPFEITPLYCGIPSYHKNKGSWGKFDIGGGYVESFGFDSDAPQDASEDGHVQVRLNKDINRFGLGDVMAATGSALGEYTDRFFPLNPGFPEFKHWSPKNPERAKEYDFVDGGYLDNTGVIALLRRKVERIIVFVNGSTGLNPIDSKNDGVSNMIRLLFKKENHLSARDFSGNIVLKEVGDTKPEESYDRLAEELRKLHAEGRPAVSVRKYKTVANKLYAIEGGFEVEIMWVHNGFSNAWLNTIQDPVLKRYILEQRKDHNFPDFSTFFTNGAKVIDLDVEQSNLMAHYASHVIYVLQDTFKRFISGDAVLEEDAVIS